VKEIRIHLRLTATYVHDVYVKKEWLVTGWEIRVRLSSKGEIICLA
jgi:hypothetical protein